MKTSSSSGETLHTVFSVALGRLSMGEDDSLSLPLELDEYLCFLFEVICHIVDFSEFWSELPRNDPTPTASSPVSEPVDLKADDVTIT